MTKPLHTLLEELACDTWGRIREAEELDIRFGEETITDLLLMEIKRAKYQNIKIVQTPKHLECESGTDWEWWIGSQRTGWLRYAVQAKKINPETDRYDSINHTVHKSPKIMQINVLKQYALSNKAIPIYCFYNYIELDVSEKKFEDDYWNCDLIYDKAQLGCSIAPLSIVEEASKTHGAKNFDWIHKKKWTIPWRCIAICPRMQALTFTGLLSKETILFQTYFGGYFHRYENLPDELESSEQLEYFPLNFYNMNIGIFPKRILVIDTSEFELFNCNL